METAKEKIIFTLLLLATGVFYRFIPHPPNFSPVAAIALFGGFYYRKYWSAFLPLAILFFTDFFLGFYEIKIMLSVYASFALIALIGIVVRKYKSLPTIIGGSLTGSLLFFLATNFAVWLFGNWYSHNLSGLANCFYMALPFFRNTLMGDLFFTSVFFGLYELALYYYYSRSLGLKYNFARRKLPNIYE